MAREGTYVTDEPNKFYGMGKITTKKEYGPHEYPLAPDATSDCKYGCGCYAGPSTSGGPLGLDPFGECPGNPDDDELIGGDRDYEVVVKRRIERLGSEAHQASRRASLAEERLGEGAIAIAEHRDHLLKEVLRLNDALEAIEASASIRGDTDPPPSGDE